jgi:hypothetical protein
MPILEDATAFAKRYELSHLTFQQYANGYAISINLEFQEGSEGEEGEAGEEGEEDSAGEE